MGAKLAFLHDLAWGRKLRRAFRIPLLLGCTLLLLTQVTPAQDSPASKIPEGEAQFTAKQLEDYYLVYKNADVRYLRTVFGACLKKSGGTGEECRLLEKWSKEYFRSKFIVLSRAGNTFGETDITILFQDRPDGVFVAWVYPEGEDKTLTLRAFYAGKFSEEDVRRIRVRYKKLIADKTHAM